MKPKFFDDHVAEDLNHSMSPTMKSTETGLPSQKNQVNLPLPNKFDLPFIERQLEKIQDSPKAVSNYFNALSARFNLGAQIGIIKKLQQFYSSISDGMKSQIEITKMRKEMVDAIIEYQESEYKLKNINQTYELKNLEAELEKQKLLTKIAALKKRQSEVDGSAAGGVGEGDTQKLRNSLEQKIRKTGLYAEYDVKKRIAEAIGKHNGSKELNNWIKEELKKIELAHSMGMLDDQEKQEAIEDLESVKEKILYDL